MYQVFVRDSTMVRPYALLLFGGDIDVQHKDGTLTLDGWIKFKAPARIGVLVMKLRQLLDNALTEKVENPEMNLIGHPVLEAIGRLLAKDGH